MEASECWVRCGPSEYDQEQPIWAESVGLTMTGNPLVFARQDEGKIGSSSNLNVCLTHPTWTRLAYQCGGKVVIQQDDAPLHALLHAGPAPERCACCGAYAADWWQASAAESVGLNMSENPIELARDSEGQRLTSSILNACLTPT